MCLRACLAVWRCVCKQTYVLNVRLSPALVWTSVLIQAHIGLNVFVPIHISILYHLDWHKTHPKKVSFPEGCSGLSSWCRRPIALQRFQGAGALCLCQSACLVDTDAWWFRCGFIWFGHLVLHLVENNCLIRLACAQANVIVTAGIWTWKIRFWVACAAAVSQIKRSLIGSGHFG